MGGRRSSICGTCGTGRDRLAASDAHSDAVRCLLFSADGKTLVTGGDDRTVRVWDAATGASRKVLSLAGQPRALDLSPDGRWLIAGAEDQGWIFVWDLAGGGKPAILFERFNSEPYPLAVRYSGRDETILDAWSDGRLREWDRKSGKIRDRKPERFLEGSLTDIEENRRCRSGSFFAGAGRLAVIRREPGLLAVNMGSGRLVCELAGATIVAASPDGRTLAVAVQRDDPYFELPSWKRGKETARRPADAPDPEGATIVLLDGETGREKWRIAAPGTTLWGLAFSPDGKTLAVTCGRGHGQIRLYRVSTGGLVRSISTPTITGPCLAFSPDGSRLATAMADTSVLLWDLRLGP